MSQAKYRMPRPTQVVVWRATPGGAPSPAIVTHVGQTAINIAIVPPDSRAICPKDAVRHVSDPLVANQLNPEEGIWDYADEFKLLMRVTEVIIDDKNDIADDELKTLFNRYYQG